MMADEIAQALIQKRLSILQSYLMSTNGSVNTSAPDLPFESFETYKQLHWILFIY